MKKIIRYCVFTLGACFALSSYSQTLSSELSALNTQNNQWYSANVSSLLQKIPINIKEVTPQQLADTSMPSPDEKKQIDMVADQRAKYNAGYAKIIRKYVSPSVAAESIITNSEELRSKSNLAIYQLRDGKINFGQYLSTRLKLISESQENFSKIVAKYQITAFMPQSQASSQANSNTNIQKVSTINKAQEEKLCKSASKVDNALIASHEKLEREYAGDWFVKKIQTDIKVTWISGSASPSGHYCNIVITPLYQSSGVENNAVGRSHSLRVIAFSTSSDGKIVIQDADYESNLKGR